MRVFPVQNIVVYYKENEERLVFVKTFNSRKSLKGLSRKIVAKINMVVTERWIKGTKNYSIETRFQ